MIGQPDKESGAPAVRRLFLEALERKSLPERQAFLVAACGEDRALLARIVALLECHREDDFLEHSAAGPDPSRAGNPDLGKPGDRIGRYRLLEQIGEGGCGVVYVAEQTEPVKRRVALKMIKPGLDTRQVVARFEAERQALALMDHPNIARFFDAGVTGLSDQRSEVNGQRSDAPANLLTSGPLTSGPGQPYFVMELVPGKPITRFCDEQHLSPRERLELFLQVCRAVQHAHQKGVIHRDLKPSNILVGQRDGVAVPKVIDFGIAKATQGELTEQTVYTQFQLFLGTPAYMSPEQAQMGGLDVDTRSDIYSLGVLLYELLVGQTPFDSKELLAAGLDEMRRIIRETEPPKPSTRLTQQLRQIAGSQIANRKSQIADDLDWIVMKCLEKDRARRYETANGLARDIERHLNYEPVLARPPSRVYRLQKLVRRNRLAFAAGAAVCLALVLAAVVSAWQASVARDRLADATAISKLLLRVFASPDPARDGRTVTVAEALGTAAKKLDSDLASQPARRAKLLATIAKTYFGLGLYAEAIPLQEKVRDYYLSVSGPDHPETLGALSELANSYAEVGRTREALKIEEDVLATSRRVLGPEHPDTLRAINDLACSYTDAGRWAEALPLQERMLTLSRKVRGSEHPDTLAAMLNLANSYAQLGRSNQAVRLGEELLALSRKVLGPEHPDTLRAMHNLARFYEGVGRRDEALELRERTLALRRKVLGPEHVETISSMHELANSYAEAGRRDEALKLREEVLALDRKVRGPEHPGTINAMGNLANSYAHVGRRAEALRLREEVLALERKVNGIDHPDTLAAMHNLINSYRDAGRWDDTLKLLEEELPALRKVRGPDNSEVAWTMIDLEDACRRLGRGNDAVRWGESARDLSVRIEGPTNENTLNAITELAISYRLAHRLQEATALEEQCLKQKRQHLVPTHPGVLESMENLAACYEASGRQEEAKALGLELAALQAAASSGSRAATNRTTPAKP